MMNADEKKNPGPVFNTTKNMWLWSLNISGKTENKLYEHYSVDFMWEHKV